MDPNEALREFNTSACSQAIQNLADWLQKGGFEPAGKLDASSMRYADKTNPDVVEAVRYCAQCLGVERR